MTVAFQRSSVFDPLDPAFLDDPYPVYARLRAAGPLVRDGVTQWVVARYEQVAALLRDPRLHSQWPEPFQQLRVGGGAARDFLLRVVLHREGPDHALLRRLLNAVMHATSGAEIRDCAARTTDAALDRALAVGRLEIMADLAFPVPIAVACTMLGVPDGDRSLVARWGLDIIKAFTVVLPPDDRHAVDASVTELRGYLVALLRDPGGGKLADIMAAMRSGEGAGRPTDELLDNLIFLLVSGFTTTVHAVATLGAVLLRHPDVYADLRANPHLVRSAIEEFLRYDAPIQHISRFAVEPVPVDGQVIRPGRVVHLLLGSANRDDRQFPAADQIDIRRDPNPHVSFGAGVHACLGAGLGRLEAGVVLGRLLDRCPTLVSAGPLVRRPVQVFRTYATLPARVSG